MGGSLTQVAEGPGHQSVALAGMAKIPPAPSRKRARATRA
jgi:hypothetical protein